MVGGWLADRHHHDPSGSNEDTEGPWSEAHGKTAGRLNVVRLVGAWSVNGQASRTRARRRMRRRIAYSEPRIADVDAGARSACVVVIGRWYPDRLASHT